MELLRYQPENNIEIGAKVPDFILVDHENKTLRLRDLLGSPAVLYFYPKDGTSGCIQEACDFRDVYHDFLELDCPVYGISPDNEVSHQDMTDKHDLPFDLCVDPDLNTIKEYGVWGEYQLNDKEAEYAKGFGFDIDEGLRAWSVVRCTFLIDKDGILVHKWMNVNFRGHASSVRNQLHKSFKFDIAF